MNERELLASDFTKLYTSPVLVVSVNRIKENVERFHRAMPRVQINYAVKANPHISILSAIMGAGGSFEIASLKELNQLQVADSLSQLNGYEPFDFSRVLYSNPVRPSRYIEEVVKHGITWFVVDNVEEANKLNDVLPNANVYIRVIVSNKDSFLPLTGKFGVDGTAARKLAAYCKGIGLRVRGLTFHVGSQCPNTQNWVNGINTAKEILKDFRKMKIEPDFLDIGGGFPVQHASPIPSIDEIGVEINKAIEGLPVDMRIVAEPGRFLVSDAGHLLCQVVSTTYRNNKQWVYLDVGIFHGLAEATVEDFKYVYATCFDDTLMLESVLAGPTCDSLDILKGEVTLPALEPGDFIVIKNAGAYTTSYGTEFNGFPSPHIAFVA